ncbi:MAG: hypothetical protein ACRD11_06455 [Terriglobia bacterium]
METTLRQRRVDNEAKILSVLAQANPDGLEILDVSPGLGSFRICLGRTSGILRRSFPCLVAARHEAEISFPRFFPDAPIEMRLLAPVFHPNIDPVNGFVCLWDRFSCGDTVAEALRRLQQIIAWKLFNLEARHLMQPEAAEWSRHPDRPLPLEFTPLTVPLELVPQAYPGRGKTHRPRRRLEHLG